MAQYPANIFTPRATENLPGIVYTPSDKRNMYSEDFQNLGLEIKAIEEVLGVDLSNIIALIEAYIPSGGGAWGEITGDILDQVDLQAQFDTKASLVSPLFTGTPTAPTQGGADNSTKLATTAFVTSKIASVPKNIGGALYLFNNY